ncbi:MAG: SDR family oxidoreductase, partial [Oscillospiraceae bacterium]|nr:SDR family oxidoreductase [Oscillospiraceae bacterium]
NAVCPGVIKTDMLNCFTEADLKSLADETPLGRLGTTQDVANMVEFVLSEKASFVTGQIIAVDGGFAL